jgi:hypothetical protein
MFQLKDKSTLFGINKELSTHDTPVFEKKLDKGIIAEANRDGTIFVDKNASPLQKREAIKHEKVHLDQMSQGRLQYDDYTVTWKKDMKSPPRVYDRASMMEGAHELEWEKEAYNKSK